MIHHLFKTLGTALLLAVVMSCGDNAADDMPAAPVTPWEMQRLLGRGFDVQWAEFAKKIEAYGADEVEAMKARGFSTARIRTALPADDYLLTALDRCIADCLSRGIIPVIAYNAIAYEENPGEKTLADCVGWWRAIANRYKDADQHLLFNLNIEWSDAAGKDQQCIDRFNKEVTAAIRETNPTRIIIYSPARLSAPECLDDLAIPAEAGKWFMVEWHLYAAGPSKDPASKKCWTVGTEAEKKAVTDKIKAGAEWQKRTGIPTWVGAWMPGNYNKGDDYTVEEQCVFAKFMIESLEKENIPWAVNSLDKFYDIYNNCWLAPMLPLIDVLSRK